MIFRRGELLIAEGGEFAISNVHFLAGYLTRFGLQRPDGKIPIVSELISV